MLFRLGGFEGRLGKAIQALLLSMHPLNRALHMSRYKKPMTISAMRCMESYT